MGWGAECGVALENHVGGAEVGRDEGKQKGMLVNGETEKVGEIELVEEIKEVKEVKRLKEVEDIELAEEMEEAEEIELAEEVKEITDIELVEAKLEQTGEMQYDDVLGSMGSQSMDIDNDSDHRMEFHPSHNTKYSNDPRSSSSTTGQASTTPRSFTPEENQKQGRFEDVPFSIKIRESTSLEPTIALQSAPGELPLSVDTLLAMEKNEAKLNVTTFPGLAEVLPAVSIEISAVAPVMFTTDANINLNLDASIQSSKKVACGAVDWDDAFD